MSMQITQEIVNKLNATINEGLIRGIGRPIPGRMCIESAISYSLGLPFSDKPSCVNAVVRNYCIRLNDSAVWKSPSSRAAGMKRLAIAQLGTNTNFDEKEFTIALAMDAVNVLIPIALKSTGKEELEKYAIDCENAKTLEEAKIAAYAAYTVVNASYAANAADNTADAASYAANATNSEKILFDTAERIVQILIKMNTPGSKFL